MLTKRIRKQIEWHFYNYAADKEVYDARVDLFQFSSTYFTS